MYIIRVEITFLDDHAKVYEVSAAFEISDESETYLAMRRLKDGGFGFIPIDRIKSWKILD
jgi:hypothetical protein